MDDQDRDTQAGGKRSSLDELQARINAAIEDLRPKMRRTLDELETKVDDALRDIRPAVDSAAKDVRPKVDRFIADVQPRMDSLLHTLQTKIAEIRRDLDERARRGSDEGAPKEPKAALPRDTSEAGSPEAGGRHGPEQDPEQGEGPKQGEAQ